MCPGDMLQDRGQRTKEDRRALAEVGLPSPTRALARHPNQTSLTTSSLSFQPWRPFAMSLSTLPTSSSSTAAVRRYTTATAYLRDHYALENIVPTSTPSVDESELPTLLAQDTHAVSSSTFFPPSTNGFVLSRVIEDAHTLELQWVSFSKGSNAVPGADADSKLFAELDEEQATLPPVRFVFPSRLVPNPSFIISATEGDTRELHVYALTEAGYLYVLRFAEPRLFYSLPEEDDEWCEEHTVPSLEARTPIMMHGVAEGRVTVACSDGFAVALGLADGTGQFSF